MVELSLPKNLQQILPRALGWQRPFVLVKPPQTTGLQQLAIWRTVLIPRTPATLNKVGRALWAVPLDRQTRGKTHEHTRAYTVSP